MLKNLLFCHGREAYRRNSQLITYMFYKNVLYVSPIWSYGLYSSLSSVLLYNTWLIAAYNVIYTSLPVIWFAVFDQEHSKSTFMNDPQLYKIGLENKWFSKKVFWSKFWLAWF